MSLASHEALLTRVEGEGKVKLIFGDKGIERVEVHIVEAPRFIEYAMRGRKPAEVPEIASRICGICSVSYQMAASTAFERGMGIDVPYEQERLREAIFTAEHVKSNVLHILYLQLPDILGASSSLEVFKKDPSLHKMAVDLFMWSRKVMRILGGRYHNVVNVRIGGVYRMPEQSEVRSLSVEAERAITNARKLSEFVLENIERFPRYEQKIRKMALCDSVDYPLVSREICYEGRRFDVSEFEDEVLPEQVSYSNSLRYRTKAGEIYVVGPISRFSTSFYSMREEVRRMLKSFGFSPPLRNIHCSVVARAAELYEFILRLADFIDSYRPEQVEVKEIAIAPGVYWGAVEAPRGILYHRYRVNERGTVEEANIVPPTSQNLLAMEEFSMEHLRKIGLVGGEELRGEMVKEVGKVIRQFDPCISCSVH
ncbi:MAG: Ni/Fe hydrogenase subunit alpha [Fervidicoccaceae archaeon]|jgi:coenzyme F420-reducing hydrogenase alpha subunit